MYRSETVTTNKAAGTVSIRIITLILMVLLTGIFSAACGGSKTPKADPSRAGEVVETTDDAVTVIDQAGREVTVPKGAKTMALSYRVIARFLITLGEGDKIKGIGKSEKFLYILEPGLKDAVDVGKGVPDLEAIAELKPDVYFHRATDIDGLEAVQELGIPAVGLSFEDPEEMKIALKILGSVLDKEDRVKELISYYDSRIKDDQSEADQIKDKKSAIVMGSSSSKVADGSMLQSRMIELAGGISSAKDLEASELWPTAGNEQIFKWNPDYIFITGSESARVTPEDLYNDPTWAEVTAVRDKHVYRMPAELDSWEFPGVVSVLGIDYMKSKMYPESMSEEQLQKNIDEFYQLSYDRTFTSEEIGY